MATANELRELANHLEKMERLEGRLLALKDAYRQTPDNEELKTAFRAAAHELAAVREAGRRSHIAVVDNTPGSVTVFPNAMSAGMAATDGRKEE